MKATNNVKIGKEIENFLNTNKNATLEEVILNFEGIKKDLAKYHYNRLHSSLIDGENKEPSKKASSDEIFFFIYKNQNTSNKELYAAFPNNSESNIRNIRTRFYRHFQPVIEVIKNNIEVIKNNPDQESNDFLNNLLNDNTINTKRKYIKLAIEFIREKNIKPKTKDKPETVQKQEKTAKENKKKPRSVSTQNVDADPLTERIATLEKIIATLEKIIESQENRINALEKKLLHVNETLSSKSTDELLKIMLLKSALN